MRWIGAILGMLFLIFGPAQAGPLFDAAKQGDALTVKALLESGASVDERGPNKATPLIAASLEGHTDTVAALIKAGADVMARNRSGFTALHAAAFSGHVETARLLLASGADVNGRINRAEKSPIFMAADEGHIEMIKLLLDHNADIVTLDNDGFSVLIRTMFRKHYDIVGLLKQNGATCPPQDAFGPEFRRLCMEAGT
ncbi:ankyrin repeat domain-containing protein [Ruegeria marina]|uniref:Ankyrin repeat-containing protein n=1 Tax=Ruegeria marina TaxID=639004 RepID=A0A1G7EYS9_9RHOB|nr:ankyrin repeat domain-containing protein [Ruegeria marina]SDE68794.1 Ankyrin repeat-containing protein [Ruegeria marina]